MTLENNSKKMLGAMDVDKELLAKTLHEIADSLEDDTVIAHDFEETIENDIATVCTLEISYSVAPEKAPLLHPIQYNDN